MSVTAMYCYYVFLSANAVNINKDNFECSTVNKYKLYKYWYRPKGGDALRPGR